MIPKRPVRIRIRTVAGMINIGILKNLQDSTSSSANEAIAKDLQAAGEMADAADENVENWNEYQNDVVDAVDQVAAAIVPNATTPSLSYAATGLANAIIAYKNSL